ncbi:hypothetical protein [Cytobacillus firmus]|uniref:hypothetical protein n=1 Tax=Cytobacillus firmus TaxID=1399 RepID=UPI0021637FE4|nr:hypothetical protein [Cytobacillus firmus]MCS0674638.1 hypothetical protein [Cytobacillus firmus]
MDKKIIPHCHVCMNEMKMGEEVVLDSIFKGIMHSNCSYLPPNEIEDQGKLEEVISRNQRWLNSFNHLILQ